MVLVSDKLASSLVSYKLNSAIERGTKPDAVGRKPYHWEYVRDTCNFSLLG